MEKINNKLFFIIILVFVIIIYHFILSDENFASDEKKNLFFKPIKNIFLTDDYYNYQINHPDVKLPKSSLGDITFNAFLYSKPTTQKIICSSHKNRADCWEDNINNCQWVHKIDGSSYCDVGPNIWP